MINFEVLNDSLLINFGGENFQDILESCKYLRLRYNAVNKHWAGDIVKYEEYLKEFQCIEPVTISELTKQQISKYISNLKELKSTRRQTDFSILNYPPLIGKPPFEDFQKIDINHMYNNNRSYCSLPTGSGKCVSYDTLVDVDIDDDLYNTIISLRTSKNL